MNTWLTSGLLLAALAVLPQDPAQDPDEPVDLPVDEADLEDETEGESSEAPGILESSPLDIPFSRRAETLARREAEYFETCDHNSDGWISFKEAEHSLILTRPEFAVFDSNSDGTIDRDEFGVRFQTLTERYGSFKKPIPKEVLITPPALSGTELLLFYDINSDRRIDNVELKRILEAYKVDDLSPDQAWQAFDTNSSGRLEPQELETIASALSAYHTPGVLPRDANVTLFTLFGEVIERPRGRGHVLQPPHIVGPIPYFRRLDLDDNGGVSVADLEELQRPIQLEVRATTLIATLDKDGDGVLSEAEFRDAME